jgi:hypothetical protein
MAVYRMFHLIRPKDGRFAPFNRINLYTSMIAGLERYGLAANGMCPSTFAQSAQQVPTQVLANLDVHEDLPIR